MGILPDLVPSSLVAPSDRSNVVIDNMNQLAQQKVL